MKRVPKVRVQVMVDVKDLELLEEIDAEHDGQLNYSQILHILIQRYKNYQKVMALLRKEIDEKIEREKQLEYELKHKEVKK